MGQEVKTPIRNMKKTGASAKSPTERSVAQLHEASVVSTSSRRSSVERDSNEFVIYTRQRIDDTEKPHQSALNVVDEDQQSSRSSSSSGSRASQDGTDRSVQKQHLPAIRQGLRSFGNRFMTSESSKDPDEASGAAPGFKRNYKRVPTNDVVSGLN